MAGQKLLELIKNQASNQIPKGIELAKVIAPYPNLIIKIDNMDAYLSKDFLAIPSRLNNDIELTIGDIISVTPLDGGNRYLILDKVVVLGG